MNYTLELKKRITKKYQKGESVSNLSKYYNIPRTSIYNWINKLSKKSFHELSISKRQLYEYQRKIEKLNRENQIQHYIISNLNIPKRNKIDLVYLLEEK